MKPFQTLRCGTLAALLLAGPVPIAEAADRDVAYASLRAPQTLGKDRILDGRIWRCREGGCWGSAAEAPRSQPVIWECRRFVRKLGEVASYRSGGRAFDAAALARCNAP